MRDFRSTESLRMVSQLPGINKNEAKGVLVTQLPNFLKCLHTYELKNGGKIDTGCVLSVNVRYL